MLSKEDPPDTDDHGELWLAPASREKSKMRNPRPAWWILYALLPLGALLLVGVELAAPSAGWRAFTECLVSLAILGAIGLWLRANRIALALLGPTSAGQEPLRAWVAYCPPAAAQRTPDLLETKPIQRQVVRTEHLGEECVTCFVK
jgi:hypothetical protein